MTVWAQQCPWFDVVARGRNNKNQNPSSNLNGFYEMNKQTENSLYRSERQAGYSRQAKIDSLKCSLCDSAQPSTLVPCWINSHCEVHVA
ncbi:hypothetical protein F2P81_017086 [Scophthalmus maximus]|uniref:Uncharacterized protein n=1 Tax=Scophthalmus maximus TaxID=52904 RepID=A0A6A4SD14_SCOMX|nr:hypothetical protein F2P81_017086 [Scophthalmus maximus]